MHLQQQPRLPRLARAATLASHLPLRHQRPATPKTDKQQLHKSKLSTATASPPWLVKTPNTGVCALTHRRLHKCPLRTDHAPNRNRWAWVSVPNWHKNTPPWNSTTNESKRAHPQCTRAHLKQHRLQQTGHHCTLLAQQNFAERQNCKNTARALNKHDNMPMAKKLALKCWPPQPSQLPTCQQT